MTSLNITIQQSFFEREPTTVQDDRKTPGVTPALPGRSILTNSGPNTPREDDDRPDALTIPSRSPNTSARPYSLQNTPHNLGEMFSILSLPGLPECDIQYVDSYKDGLALQDKCPITHKTLEEQLKEHFKSEQTPFVFALVESKPTSDKDSITQSFCNAIALQKGLQQKSLKFSTTDCKVHYFIINELPTTETPSPIHYIITCSTLQMASKFDYKNPTIAVKAGYDNVDQYIQNKDYLRADTLFQYLRTISTVPSRFACFESVEINERTAKQYTCKRTCETIALRVLAAATGFIPFFTPPATSFAIHLGVNGYYLLHCFLRSRLTKNRCITYLDPHISTAGIVFGISNVAKTILQYAEHIPFGAISGMNVWLSMVTVGTSICKKTFWRCQT